MRAVLQRVLRAEVRVGDERVGQIARGLLILLGAGHDDSDEDVTWLAEKISGLRVFSDDKGLMNLALTDVGGAVLVVSQFTLYGDCRKGRRPSFVAALPPGPAEILYLRFIESLRARGLPVEHGRFGADMAVELVNDGPVTLLLDTRKAF